MQVISRKPSKRSIKDRLGYDPTEKHALCFAVRTHFRAEDQRESKDIERELQTLVGELDLEEVDVTSTSYRVDGKMVTTYDVEVGRFKKESGRSLLQRLFNEDEDYPLVVNFNVSYPVDDERLSAQAAQELRTHLVQSDIQAKDVHILSAWYRCDNVSKNAYDYEKLRHGEDVERIN